MASLSLPRVLQHRKTSLDLERENFEKGQTTAISKAINNLETPVKQKHVRSTIIGTFTEKGAQTFWLVALRLPLQENRIVAWKFCHVLHKVLREGHPNCIQHSLRHRDELENLAQYWKHLREGYGKLIKLYCDLLITKLDFHRKNPGFPGSLALSSGQLEKIGENDIDNYFEMSVEMFDYMDSILDLQSTIFGSMDMSRSTSMTSTGQCRLSPLIPCIQDASKLYDYCVKILFKLHSALPPDTLSGHRERFLKQFKELKQFYQNTSTLQYFKNLITIPSLPDKPPNFLIQAELRTYVTPVVIVPAEEEPEPQVEGNLIDTSSPVEETDSSSRNGALSTSHLMDLITKRDELISHLESENRRLGYENHELAKKSSNERNDFLERIQNLETDLATKDSELVQERQVKDELFQQASAIAQNQDSEFKSKEEKFNKLLSFYPKLKQEHVELIRKKAEVDKQLNTARNQLQQSELSKTEMEAKLKELQRDNERMHEGLQQKSTDHKDEIAVIHNELKSYAAENEELQSKIKRLVEEKEGWAEKIDALTAQKASLEGEIAGLVKEAGQHSSQLSELKAEKKAETREVAKAGITEAESLIRHAVDEVDNPALLAVSCSPDYLSSLTEMSLKTLGEAKSVSWDRPREIVSISSRLAHVLATCLLQGKATSNTSPDITFGEQMAEKCKQLGACVLRVLDEMKNEKNLDYVVEQAITELKAMTDLAETLRGTLKEDLAEQLADLVENELHGMDKAIEEAAKIIQEMLSKSRAADSGVKLQVNEKILDSCTTLMQAIRMLVQKSRLLQAEIVAQGRGSSSVKEFYKRNHRWTDGLLSAAKAVARAAKFLLNAADKVVTEQGKLEQLVVAAQEIAASTAQLVVASRVKADRNSQNLDGLSQASKKVTSATGGVIATVKDCSQLVDEAEEMDTTGLTLHSAKRLEMEAQVRVLELEKELEQQRLKLLALRRHHYQLAGEGEG